MSRESLTLTDELRDYLVSMSLREPEVLKRLRSETEGHPEARFQIAPEQGQFMGLLVRMLGARRAIEIGVFTGYSAICTALALPDDGRLVACDINTVYTDIAKAHFEEAGVSHKVDLRIAPAMDTLDQLIAEGKLGTFDFAFIDADKERYHAYYERLLKLLRSGGVIAVDNVLWSGRVIEPSVTDTDTEAIRRFNAELHRDDRIHLAMVPIGDGLTLALKR